MIMKLQTLPLLVAVTTCTAPAAFAFAQIARGEAVLSTSARATYDSRVFGGYSTADDTIFTLDPRLIYKREAGQIKMEANLGMRFNRYLDYSELDSDDLVTSVELRLPSGGPSIASGSFLTSYDEHTDVNYDVNRRVREKTFLTRLNGVMPLSVKTAVLLSGMFRKDERNQFSDRETREGSAGFRYMNFLGGSMLDLRYRRLEVETDGGNEFGIALDQKSDIYSATFSRPLYQEARGFVTYGYRVLHRSRAEVFGADDDSSGSIFSVGIEGPFLSPTRFPKLDSSLSLSYQEAETPGIQDSMGKRFVGALHLGWQARERTEISFNARRSIELSIQDRTVEMTSVHLGVNQAIGNFMTGSISGGFESRDYRLSGPADREDDAFIFRSALHYRITRTWSANAEYRLRSTDSNVGIADYARHVVVLSGTYTF